jgi:hypothetical protein
MYEIDPIPSDSFNPSLFPKADCESDTDGDGTFNHHDLDSDGDGCSDALEAGATTDDSDNFAFPASGVGANGLADVLETTADNAEINYSSTYNRFALSENLAACVDTDGDGIMDLVDIDDDNDGTLDHIESPNCFMLETKVDMVEVTTSLTNYSTNSDRSFEELYDGVYDNYAAYGSLNTLVTNQSVFEFIFAQPIPIKAFEVTHQYSIFKSGAKFKIQGFDGTVWVDLSGEIDGIENTNTTNTYNITQNEGDYSRYRFYGISGKTDYNRIYEIDPIPADSFNPSLYPKEDCESDTDGDGTFNHQDLDSDGDGCSDGVEASTLELSQNNTSQYPTGADTSGNGLLDNYDEDLLGSYYKAFALDENLNSCTDTDGDDVVDVVDLDDDNDGVPDTSEQTSDCYYVGGTTDFRQLSFNNPSRVNINAVASDSIAVKRISGSWVTSYTNNTFERPVELKFKVDDVNSNSMIGLIGTTKNQTLTNWNDESHKFYFNSGSQYDVRYLGNDGPQINYNAGDEFVISIDEVGNLTMSQNDTVVFTDEVADTEFQFVMTTGNNNFKTYYDIFLEGNVDTFPRICEDIDTDGDGTPNRLDLDSDGDGCSDALEAGATSDDTDNFAFPTSGVGANGLAPQQITAKLIITLLIVLMRFQKT